jgi:hypothetical protein
MGEFAEKINQMNFFKTKVGVGGGGGVTMNVKILHHFHQTNHCLGCMR